MLNVDLVTIPCMSIKLRMYKYIQYGMLKRKFHKISTVSII